MSVIREKVTLNFLEIRAGWSGSSYCAEDNTCNGRSRSHKRPSKLQMLRACYSVTT